MKTMVLFSVFALSALASCVDSPSGPDLSGIPAPPDAPAAIADERAVVDFIIVDKNYPNAVFEVDIWNSASHAPLFDTTQGVWMHRIFGVDIESESKSSRLSITVRRRAPKKTVTVNEDLTNKEYKRIRIDF